MHSLALAVAELKRLYPAPAPKPHPIAGFFIALAALSVFFWTMESLWPEDSGQRKLRAGAGVDLFYWLFSTIGGKIAAAGAATSAIVLILLRVPHHFSIVTQQPLWLQWMEAMLVGDFCGYWTHRTLHEIPALWRFHAIHHSSEKLDWLAAGRVHPLETVINRTLVTIPLFVFGFSPAIPAVYGPFLAIYPIFLHANVRWSYGPLRWIVASPAFHRWHHAADAEALDKNYAGLFPFWDCLFNTAYFPRGEHPKAYGVRESAVPKSVYRQFIYPFRGA